MSQPKGKARIAFFAAIFIYIVCCDFSCKSLSPDPTFVSVKIHVDYQRLVILYPDFSDRAGLFGSWVGMQTRVEMTLESPNFFSADARTAIDCQMDGQRKKYWVMIEDAKLANPAARGQGIVWVNGGVQLEETEMSSGGFDARWIFYVKDGQVYAH